MKPSRREFAAGIGAGALLGACATPFTDADGSAAGDGAAPKLFYLGATKVFSLDAAGGATRVLVDEAPKDGSRGNGLNDGIAIHSRTGQIYWTNMGRASDNDGWIKRSEKDGSRIITIVPAGGTFTPKQLKIDEKNGKLYWSDREGMAVMRCNLDGSRIETLVITGDPVVNKGDETRWCVGIAVDAARGHVYWTQKGGDNAGTGVIRRCSTSMPAGANAVNRTDIVTLFSHLPEPIDLDLDLATRTLYWTDRGDNTISRAPMDPRPGFDPARRTDRQILVSGLKEAIGVALDLPRRRMAYTSLGGEVGMAALDGSGAKLLLTEQGTLTGICWA